MINGWRAGLAAAAGAAVCGCGFHPLYAPGSAANTAMPTVFVDVIANRNGQILRQALQERLEGTDANVAKQYELTISYQFASTGLGIQADNSSDRTRFIGTALWTLKRPGTFGTKVTSGVARSVDGANVINAQFFYSDLSAEAIQRRMGDALADQIAQQLAVYFRSHPAHA
jgi:LPS-assembly lipoprotein